MFKGSNPADGHRTEKMAKGTNKTILLCFVSTEVEQSTQNHKIEGSNPANGQGN